MTQATDTDIKEIKDLLEKLDRKVDLGFAGIREEMRVSFAEVKGDINVVKSDIKTLDTKFDERSKGTIARLDAKELTNRNINTGLTVTIVGGTLLALAKFLFFGSTP